MVRFLTIACLCMAILVALCGLASRFTVTVTIRPVEAQPQVSPREIPAEAPAADVQPQSKPIRRAADAATKVDSHHTKGA